MTAGDDHLHGRQLTHRLSVKAACDQSASVLLRPSHGQYGPGLSSGPKERKDQTNDTIIYSGFATKILFASLHSASIQLESSLHYVNKLPLGEENCYCYIKSARGVELILDDKQEREVLMGNLKPRWDNDPGKLGAAPDSVRDRISPTIYASNIEQFRNSATSQTVNDEKQIHAIVDGKTLVISESSVGRDLLFNDANGITCLTNEQIFENLLLMGYEGALNKLTFQKALFSPQRNEKFSGIVTPLFATMLAQPAVLEGEGSRNLLESQPTPSPAQPINESQIPESSPSPLNTQSPRQTLEGTGSGSGLGCQKTLGGAMAQIRYVSALIQRIDPPLSTGYTVRSGKDMMEYDIKLTDPVPQTPHDSPLSGGHTPRSDEGSMTLEELTDLCTTLLQKVFDLENVKTAHEMEISSLKKRDTKLEQRQSSRFSGIHPFRAGSSKRHGLGRRKVSKQMRKNLKSQQMFQDINDVLDEDADIGASRLEDSTAKPKTPPTSTTLFDDEDVTIADTLVKIKNQKAKEKGIAFKDANDSVRPMKSITTIQPLSTIDPKDKGKGILQESKPLKKTKKKDQDQIERDAKVSLKIQADLNEEARTERERQEEVSKAALAEMYDELAKESAEAIRSKPPTKTQLRNLMMTYLKHTGSEEEKKRTRIRKKGEAGSGSSSKHKSPKKHEVNDQESEDSDKEYRKCLKVVSDDDKAIDYKTLDVKSLNVDFLDKQDVLDLYKIIMKMFPANDYKRKRYPLNKEILEKMLSSRLEAETESTFALDLIKFIKL
uniref:Uncharacterized protein n=1 Tax=Tanacetum cinerariifolium TaxID=118510 RepID=A0A6L2LXP9_TANCI|nr:hypothetical protein [Tanacetum cinerariifolium]